MDECKCPYCDNVYKTFNGLCKHAVKHNITKEKLLGDFKYGGIRPTCKCGCGEYTEISYEGGAHFRDYIIGHASRIHNNWGHNRNAQEKSAATRRKQYKEGERIQWNKGKKWSETYTNEQIEQLYEILHSEERGRKISNKLKGVPKSEEHVKKIIERMNSGEFSISSKNEEKFIEEFIKPLGIEFKHQYYIKEIKQFADVFIPSKNTIIEYDGDFWHCNPNKFKNGPKYEIQSKKVNKDLIKAQWCKENGVKLIRFWESDVLENVKNVIDTLHKELLLE